MVGRVKITEEQMSSLQCPRNVNEGGFRLCVATACIFYPECKAKWDGKETELTEAFGE